MLNRILEPELMDTAADAREYDAMDHAAVNTVFVNDLLRALTDWSLQRPVATVQPPSPARALRPQHEATYNSDSFTASILANRNNVA
jgi:hypothetical protein